MANTFKEKKTSRKEGRNMYISEKDNKKVYEI